LKIAMASDHAGYQLKEHLLVSLRQAGHTVLNLAGDANRSDYPSAAQLVASSVAEGHSERGILVCGSGIGVCIAANKARGIRAANVNEPLSAKLAREHNDANVLCLGERLVGADMALEIVRVFLETDHAGGRHHERVKQIEAMEGRPLGGLC
jgi:ribose 5-phosphate isomerase B